MRTVSVLIPCYDGAPTLPLVLEALARQDRTGLDLEVLVIDDASRDETASLAEDFARSHPWVRVLRHEANRGLSQALETGRAAARGDALVTLHEDIVPRRPDWIRQMIQAMEADRTAAVGSRVHQHVEHLPWLDRFWLEERPRFVLGLKAEAYDARAVAAVGGFDAGLRHAGEDVDLANRLRRAGYTFSFPRSLDVDHVMSRRQRGLPRLVRKEIQLAEVQPTLWRRYGYCTAALHGFTLLSLILAAALALLEPFDPPVVGVAAAAPLVAALVMNLRHRPGFTIMGLSSFGLFGAALAATLGIEPLTRPATALVLGIATTEVAWNLVRGLAKALRLREVWVLPAALPLFLVQDFARAVGFLKGLGGLLRRERDDPKRQEVRVG